jgi:hypothetical protein
MQTDKAALEAQLAGAQQEAATGQAEARAAREEAAHLVQQLEAVEQSKVPSGRILADTALQTYAMSVRANNNAFEGLFEGTDNSGCKALLLFV